jgi:hypothetical protein
MNEGSHGILLVKPRDRLRARATITSTIEKEAVHPPRSDLQVSEHHYETHEHFFASRIVLVLVLVIEL